MIEILIPTAIAFVVGGGLGYLRGKVVGFKRCANSVIARSIEVALQIAMKPSTSGQLTESLRDLNGKPLQDEFAQTKIGDFKAKAKKKKR